MRLASRLAPRRAEPASLAQPAGTRDQADPIDPRSIDAAMLGGALRHLADTTATRGSLPAPPAALVLPLTMLWSRVHRFDAGDPRWPDRDRFILSTAVASPLLYALLHLTGHAGMEQPALDHCGEPDAIAAAAAEYALHPAIEATAAPGSQAIAAAVGSALAERMLAARFGKSLVDHRTWAVARAGELASGLAQEVTSLAGQLRLDRLVLLADGTGAPADDARARFAAIGWAVKSVDCQDAADIDAALSFAVRSRKPTLVWCAGEVPRRPEPRAPAAMEAIGTAWRAIGQRGTQARRGWLKRIARHPQRAEFERVLAGRLPEAWLDPITALRQQLKVTRERTPAADICRQTLDRLVAAVPELVCARTAEALPTRAELGAAIQPGQYGGRHLDFDHRPHGMAACLTGLALHGSILPVAIATMAETIDQVPALRMAAAQRQRVVHLCVQAAPDHAPVGLLACLQLIPNLQLLQPHSALEAAECLEQAIRRHDGPTMVVLPCEPGDG